MSELPFRMLCRKYGAELCYTPMYHSRLFAEEAKYRYGLLTTTSPPLRTRAFCCTHSLTTLVCFRQMEFSTCPEDRPLVVQVPNHQPPRGLAIVDHFKAAAATD